MCVPLHHGVCVGGSAALVTGLWVSTRRSECTHIHALYLCLHRLNCSVLYYIVVCYHNGVYLFMLFACSVVEFKDEEFVKKAIEVMNKHDLNGRPLNIKEVCTGTRTRSAHILFVMCNDLDPKDKACF